MIHKLPAQIIKILENLNEGQLHTLYQLTAQRLKLMHAARAVYAMKDFNILDRVYFDHNGKRIEGIVTRLNQRTITVTTDDSGHWNVSPGLLTRIEPAMVKNDTK